MYIRHKRISDSWQQTGIVLAVSSGYWSLNEFTNPHKSDSLIYSVAAANVSHWYTCSNENHTPQGSFTKMVNHTEISSLQIFPRTKKCIGICILWSLATTKTQLEH